MTLSSAVEPGRVANDPTTRQSGGAAEFGIREVLVPTDFSLHANTALKYAIRFAENFAAGLTLLRVLRPPMQSPEGSVALPSAESLNQLSLAGMENLVHFCRREGLNFPRIRQVIVTIGEPCATIVETATELRVDLIILATHGRTGLAHVFRGSLADRVIRGAPCPVLVLRDPLSATRTTRSRAQRCPERLSRRLLTAPRSFN